MLSLIKTWQCDIWPHALRLRNGTQVVMSCERIPDEPLETALTALLSARPAAMAWLDAIEFYLDTDELDFLVIPWQNGIKTPQELLSIAQREASKRFTQPHWQVRFEDVSWGQPALVACLQQTCWQMLAKLSRQHHLRFQGVVTPFQLLLHRFNRRLPVEGIFAAIGPMRSRVACRQDQQWRDVHCLNLPQQGQSEQLQIIGRLAAMPDSPRFVINTTDWQTVTDSREVTS
ncbi:hypothetical protein [Pantoea cypripedii]|uniref:Uncharacterized protein n=1 Tax=Pantoea cypripedii TaxID=55209 RepID=A0A6B9G8U9_PANCY|nr:hypothetical protein [Pantoea cypripedii]QGY32263.1 hypothetical protein CUN67_25055 [Pantoea cypripedii]